MSKMEDKIPGFTEEFSQNRNWMVETTGKEIASKVASKRVVRLLLSYLKKTEVGSKKRQWKWQKSKGEGVTRKKNRIFSSIIS